MLFVIFFKLFLDYRYFCYWAMSLVTFLIIVWVINMMIRCYNRRHANDFRLQPPELEMVMVDVAPLPPTPEYDVAPRKTPLYYNSNPGGF
jgi:hypothetical protein